MVCRNPNSEPKLWLHIHKAWQVATIQPPGLTGSHYQACHRFFRRSTYTVLAWVWGLFTVKHRMPTSNTNTQQSEFGPADDTGRAFSSADITESLASPSSCSQRLRPALSNQRTQTCTFKMKLLHLVLKKDTDRHPVTGNIDVHGLNNTCTVQAQDSRLHLHTHTENNQIPGQSQFMKDSEHLGIFTCKVMLKIETQTFQNLSHHKDIQNIQRIHDSVMVIEWTAHYCLFGKGSWIIFSLTHIHTLTPVDVSCQAMIEESRNFSLFI